MPRPWKSGSVAVSTARTARRTVPGVGDELPAQERPEPGDPLADLGDPHRRRAERVLEVLPGEVRLGGGARLPAEAALRQGEDRRQVVVGGPTDRDLGGRRAHGRRLLSTVGAGQRCALRSEDLRGRRRRAAAPGRGLVVLIYHRVGRRTHTEVDLPLALFDDQIAWLAATLPVVSLDDGLAWRRVDRATGRRTGRRVAVTFDDGTADFADLAVPVLDRYRVPATLYVATAFVEEQRLVPERRGADLAGRRSRDCVGTGLVTVGSHTHTHALLDRLPDDEVAGELDRSIDAHRRAGRRDGDALRLSEGADGLPGRRPGRARPVRVRRARRRSGEPAGSHRRSPPGPHPGAGQRR